MHAICHDIIRKINIKCEKIDANGGIKEASKALETNWNSLLGTNIKHAAITAKKILNLYRMCIKETKKM